MTDVQPAPRLIALQGARNLRDIGGLGTESGRIVRTGRYFRGDDWSKLSPADLATVGRLGLRTVIDLRTREEIRQAHDRLPHPKPHWLHLPAFGENPVGSNLVFLFKHRHRFGTWLSDSYCKIIRERQGFFRDLFRLLAVGGSYPVFVHCTAGKDRTGLATALLLLILGVPQAEVVAEYALTNRAVELWFTEHEPALHWLRWLHLGRKELEPLLQARPAYLEAALELIGQHWGSAEAYLLDAGVTKAQLEAVRSHLLA